MKKELRVLIAEDSREDALLIVHELRAAGFSASYLRVETGEDLKEALKEPWDIVITDYSMPRLSGLEVPSIVWESGLELPVIVVSGAKGEDFAVTAMKAGADDYIVKSNLSKLPHAVERAIRDFEMLKEHRKTQEEVRHLNKLFKTTSEINKMMVRETDKTRLLSEACRILVEEGGFRMAFAGMADYDTGKVNIVARSGFGENYLEEVSIRCDDSPGASGPTGRAIRSGEHVICKDIETDEIFAPWRKAAIERGYRSCASFPLTVRGKVVGAVAVYGTNTAVFEEKMIILLDGLAGDIGYALQAIDEAGERKMAEAALRESEERLRTIFESAMDGMFVVDMEGRFMDLNRAECRMFGYTRDEILSSDLSLLFSPEDYEKMLANIRESLKKADYLPAIRLKKKDGSEIWVDMAITPFRVADKNLVLGVKRDITGRKRAEEALRESEERFRQIFEQNEDAQLIFRYGTCEILDANPAAVRLYGYTREELMASGPALFMGGPEKTKCEDILGKVSGGRGFSIETVETFKKDGTGIIASIKGQIIKLRQSDVVYCTVRDMTEKIRLEEEARLIQSKLIHANKMTSLGTLASGVAHEINNPNNFILFNSSLLMEAWNDAVKILDEYYRNHGDFTLGGLPFTEMSEVVPELLSGLAEGSRRIKSIVDNLKDFSRMDKSGMEAEFDVNGSVAAAVSILSNQISRYTDHFHISYAEGLPAVKGSSQKIEQVIINLIMNALHALAGKDRSVRVSTAYDPAACCVVIEVKDEGTGMTREVLERITEPFFTTKTDTGGTGLGLSISYSIVKEHRGALEFESSPGAGTAAVVRLPASGCYKREAEETVRQF